MTHDEQEVVAFVERIELDLARVLERHTQILTEDGHPRYSRWLALHSVIDLAGRLALSALFEEGEEARPKILTMVRHLEMLVAPASRRPH